MTGNLMSERQNASMDTAIAPSTVQTEQGPSDMNANKKETTVVYSEELINEEDSEDDDDDGEKDSRRFNRMTAFQNNFACPNLLAPFTTRHQVRPLQRRGKNGIKRVCGCFQRACGGCCSSRCCCCSSSSCSPPKELIETSKGDNYQVRVAPREEQGLKGLTNAPGEVISDFANWLLRQTFLAVILVMLAFYFIFIIMFCFLLVLGINMAYSRRNQMVCCEGYNFVNNTAANNYDVIFELSWTTFSTVGYGTVAVPADEECQAIRYLLAVEAFLGIIFTSVCGAIFYSKIGRLHTQAHVTFSSCICLHYGRAVMDPTYDIIPSDRFDSDSEHHTNKEATTHSPIIELRCVNDRTRSGGGEIISARLRGVVTTIEEAASERGEELSHHSDDDLNRDMAAGSPQFEVRSQAVTNLTLSPDTHPYFATGVWVFRHVLDRSSPLLKQSVKQRIVDRGGWPAELNSPTKIRESLNDAIQEIVITFSGTSHLTADQVSLNQSYTLSDIYIGWKFASLAFLTGGKKNKPITVDIDQALIHDIQPVLVEEYEALDAPNDDDA